jgi:hypothetical protein
MSLQKNSQGKNRSLAAAAVSAVVISKFPWPDDLRFRAFKRHLPNNEEK